MSGRARAGLLVAYALLTPLSFAQPAFGLEWRLGVVLGWLAPACLLFALRGLAPVRAGAVGLLAGLASHALLLHWIYVVVVRYGHAPPVAGAIAPVLLALYPALFVAAFACGSALLAARFALAAPFALAALWTALDHGQTFLLTGLPWALLGYAQEGNPWLMGLAPLAGVYALGFVTMLGAAGLVAATTGLPGCGRQPRAALAALLGVALLHGIGAIARTPDAAEDARRVRVAVLQGNIDQGVKWTPDWGERTLAIYEDLARRAASEGAELVVWPETAIPAAPEVARDVSQRLSALARETGAVQVIGAVGVTFADDPAAPPRLFDSAFAVDRDGRFVDRYDKSHLVPFGEYLPLRALLGRFVRAVATGSAGRDASPGPRPRRVDLPLDPPLAVGVPICFELIFPDLVRRFAADGAGLLLGITNDAWYGRTGAPLQFLSITAMRSAETGLWGARAANSGVSGFIDQRGRIVARTGIFERDLMVVDVPVASAGQSPTFYVRTGDWLPAACWVTSATLVGIALAGGRRRADPARPPPGAEARGRANPIRESSRGAK